jgi:hypothetical protein
MQDQEIVDDRLEVLYKTAKENPNIKDPFDDSNDQFDNQMDYRMIHRLICQLEEEIEYSKMAINDRIYNIDEYLSEIIANLYLSDSSREALEDELMEALNKYEQ